MKGNTRRNSLDRRQRHLFKIDRNRLKLAEDRTHHRQMKNLGIRGGKCNTHFSGIDEY